MSSKAMEGEHSRIPHRAKITSEVGDLRDDVDDSFERFEGLVDWPRLTLVPGGGDLSQGGSPVRTAIEGVNLLQGKEKASLVIGEGTAILTFTANRPGTDGNDLSVEIVDVGGGGSVSVSVAAGKVTIDKEGGSDDAAAIKAACELVADFNAIMTVEDDGVGGAGEPAVTAEQNLAGGTGEGLTVTMAGVDQPVVAETTDTLLTVDLASGVLTIGDMVELLVVSNGVAAPPMALRVIA